MRFIVLLLATAVSVIAQDSAAAADTTAADPSETSPSNAPATITDLAAVPSVTLDSSESSLLAQGACLTGKSYSECMAPVTLGTGCVIGADANANAKCACSSASRVYSCAGLCSLSIPDAVISQVSTVCVKYGGIGISTGTGAGATATGTAAKAGSTGAAGHFAMPTGVAAAVGIVGAMAAIL